MTYNVQCFHMYTVECRKRLLLNFAAQMCCFIFSQHIFISNHIQLLFKYRCDDETRHNIKWVKIRFKKNIIEHVSFRKSQHIKWQGEAYSRICAHGVDSNLVTIECFRICGFAIVIYCWVDDIPNSAQRYHICNHVSQVKTYSLYQDIYIQILRFLNLN